MLLFRDPTRRVDPGPCVAALADQVERLTGDGRGLRRLLIELGQLEAGLADALATARDAPGPLEAALREALVAAGRLFARAVDAAGVAHPVVPSATRLAELRGALARVARGPLPPSVSLRVPEGFAHYALYPEQYLAAARRLGGLDGRVVCLGLRTIGCALSAVVAGALREANVAVESFTVRPRGRAWDRRLAVGGRLAEALARADHVLVVDEGPGLSGSSLTGAAAAAVAAGVPARRVVLLPSWDSDGSDLRSEAARRRWRRHPRVVAPFSPAWVEALRAPCEELSAGRWRARLPGPNAPIGQLERRKYLVGARLLRFVGLDREAPRRVARAVALAEAGFAPPVLGAADGFLSQPLLDGARLGRGAPRDDELARLADYLGVVADGLPGGEGEPAPLLELVRVNVGEALGAEGAARVRAVEGALARALAPRRVVQVDGRLDRHEWVRAGGTLWKCDALDHGDGHFWPGPTDPAWDLAGAVVEWRLDGAERARLIARWTARTGDRAIAARLPAFVLAYLAFRVALAGLESGARRRVPWWTARLADALDGAYRAYR